VRRRICSCGRLVTVGTACVCRKQAMRAADARRPSARARGYDTKWQRESKAFLARPENRFCACGCGQVADMVDHKRAHKGSPELFWDRSNWRPMTLRCNSRKAVRTEGAFGRAVRCEGV
jgi:5-methylcytosine-specific restriction endonuclease McrA